MKKWMIRTLSALLIVAFLPTTVLAAEWNLGDGSIEITATGTTQTVSQGERSEEDSNPTITSNSNQTSNTITIKAEKDTTANVTIKDTNIDTTGTGKAAVQIKGEGDVNLNVEGTNTVTSGSSHAGVEKPDYKSGNLTIGSESGNGKLTANGGDYAAGIGGGIHQSGKHITITGGEITANGGRFGAGIGGGYYDPGFDITISGGKVTANGGTTSAGIGGGGIYGRGYDITISGDAQVKATGGARISTGSSSYGCGAAIGNAGSNDDYGNGNVINGSEIDPDTSGLYTTGKVERKRGCGAVLDTIVGTVEPPKPDEPEKPTEPEKPIEPEKSASAEEEEPLYWVLHLDWTSLEHQEQKTDGVLALTAKADGAILTGKLRGLRVLQNQGIEKITFTDGTHSAELVLADLIAKGQPEAVYVLTLGAENTLTLNGEAIDF